MALRIRSSASPGMTLYYSIERLYDNTFWDFATTGTTAQTFTATPTTMLSRLPASNGSSSIYPSGVQANLNGGYAYVLATSAMPAAQFTDGRYCIRIHNANASNQEIEDFSVVLFNQDDEPVFPAGSTDPWTTSLPGTYAAGEAGNIVGNFLNASVSSRLAASAYVTPPTVAEIATGVLTDTNAADLGVAGSLGAVSSIIATAPTWYVSGGGGGLSLTTPVPLTNTANTVGDCLNGARAQAFGGWKIIPSVPPQLIMLAPDGITVVRSFTLDNFLLPMMRS